MEEEASLKLAKELLLAEAEEIGSEVQTPASQHVNILELASKREAEWYAKMAKGEASLREYLQKTMGEEDTTLRGDESCNPPLSQRPLKRLRTVGASSSAPDMLPPADDDALLNLQLPKGIVFVEGRVLSRPAGIFYTSKDGDEKFFRLSEIDKASTHFLTNIREICSKDPIYSNFLRQIEQELAKPHRAT